MMDAGWKVNIWKNDIGTYTSTAYHKNVETRKRVLEDLASLRPQDIGEHMWHDAHWTDSGQLVTDDATPEQSLTRLAYKVHGEII